MAISGNLGCYFKNLYSVFIEVQFESYLTSLYMNFIDVV